LITNTVFSSIRPYSWIRFNWSSFSQGVLQQRAQCSLGASLDGANTVKVTPPRSTRESICQRLRRAPVTEWPTPMQNEQGVELSNWYWFGMPVANWFCVVTQLTGLGNSNGATIQARSLLVDKGAENEFRHKYFGETRHPQGGS